MGRIKAIPSYENKAVPKNNDNCGPVVNILRSAGEGIRPSKNANVRVAIKPKSKAKFAKADTGDMYFRLVIREGIMAGRRQSSMVKLRLISMP